MSHHKIDYIEMPSANIGNTKTFFNQVFGWEFTDYGPDYTAVNNAGIGAGFYQTDLSCQTQNGSVLVVLYSNNIEQSLQQVEQAGGTIIKPIFSFPGGRRFQFNDPNGNEFAVWSE